MLDNINSNKWRVSNIMSVNTTKSNVIHFSPNSISRTTFRFTCCRSDLQIIDKYKYIGLVLDFSIPAKLVSQSACRALDLL